MDGLSNEQAVQGEHNWAHSSGTEKIYTTESEEKASWTRKMVDTGKERRCKYIERPAGIPMGEPGKRVRESRWIESNIDRKTKRTKTVT
ncbi:hypothetical protein LSAT2_006394, partial [Lamellibrachia satsuma]